MVVERRAELDGVAFGVDLEEVRGDFKSLEIFLSLIYLVRDARGRGDFSKVAID